MPNSIRIANVYYLLSYAWDYWAQGDIVDVGQLHGTDTTNLLAILLDAGARHAIRRGLHRDYQTYEREIAGIRGRLLVGRSKQRLLFEHGRAACAIGELNHCSTPNRIIRSTLELLRGAETLDPTVRDQLGRTLRELHPIPKIRLSPGLFRRVRISRSNAHYTFLLSLCELAFDCVLPNPSGSETRFRDFADDDVWMHDLFEDFVRNFYRAHADSRGWICQGRTQIDWLALPADEESKQLLPRMTTDVTLQRESQLLILDCKYYADALRGRFSPKLDSDNLYQVWSYVSQQRMKTTLSVEGLLLYPTVTREFTAEYSIDGNRIRAATVNLDASWSDIRDRLLELIAAVPAELV